MGVHHWEHYLYNPQDLRNHDWFSLNYYPAFKTIADEIHPDYPKSGGPLSIRELSVTHSDAPVKVGSQKHMVPGSTAYPINDYWEGNYRAIHAFGPPPPEDISTSELGPDAWNIFKPAQPDVSLAQFFGEMTSMKDMIFKRLDSFKNLGSNYLAVEFGWKPFLSDLRSWYSSLLAIDTKVAQLRRDNGRWIRRGGTFQTDNPAPTSVDLTQGFEQQNGLTDIKSTKTTTFDQRSWFSGAFRYYIPGLMSKRFGKLRAVRELWDLKIGPEQVYELIPFSWLVDWHSNLGSVISNLQSSVEDHLVAKYAYVMRHTSTRVKVESSARTLFATYQAGRNPTWEYHYSQARASTESVHVTKTRAVADPFGFSVNLPSYSTWQKSILMALALSSGKRLW
jgi:hypothetical protein